MTSNQIAAAGVKEQIRHNQEEEELESRRQKVQALLGIMDAQTKLYQTGLQTAQNAYSANLQNEYSKYYNSQKNLIDERAQQASAWYQERQIANDAMRIQLQKDYNNRFLDLEEAKRGIEAGNLELKKRELQDLNTFRNEQLIQNYQLETRRLKNQETQISNQMFKWNQDVQLGWQEMWNKQDRLNLDQSYFTLQSELNKQNIKTQRWNNFITGWNTFSPISAQNLNAAGSFLRGGSSIIGSVSQKLPLLSLFGF